MADESVSIRGVYNLTNPKRAQMLADGGVTPPGIDPYPDALVLTDTQGRVLMDGLTAIAVHEAA